ncbi:nectin-1 isoform X2 [Monodelphis domestica]|uniref:Nectin-1 n=1 Tax=Monodelphis domestica TaxID=13616 RepID=F7FAD9_MONDO|nr:nectin-1 isoform X2 [Monodelphis domestica]
MARMGHAVASGCWWAFALSLATLFLPGLQAQVVQVNDTVSGFIGTDVVLHCSFSNPLPMVRITQMTWQKATNGSKQNVAIYNPNMGVSVLAPYRERVTFLRPSFTDGTIRLSHLELEDEGVYICEFATFPTGNRESQLNLTVLAKPTNWMEVTKKILTAKTGQTEKVLVATCISANGKPPSTVSWDTRLKGEAEFQEIRHPNGTVTVISRYRLVPSREAHKQPLACVVNYQLDRFSDSITLNVQYEPEVTIEGFDGNWYLKRMDVKLTCQCDANPPVTHYQWKMLNGTLPSSMDTQNKTLFFKGPVTYSLSGTYICEATNPIGTRSGMVEVNITDKPLGGPGGLAVILGSLVSLAAAVALFMFYRQQQKNNPEMDSDQSDLSTSHKASPVEDRRHEMNHVTSDVQVVDLDNIGLDESEMEQKLPLQTPYYDLAGHDTLTFSQDLFSGLEETDLHYAELDTTTLESSPRTKTTPAPGELVEYAIIQSHSG